MRPQFFAPYQIHSYCTATQGTDGLECISLVRERRIIRQGTKVQPSGIWCTKIRPRSELCYRRRFLLPSLMQEAGNTHMKHDRDLKDCRHGNRITHWAAATLVRAGHFARPKMHDSRAVGPFLNGGCYSQDSTRKDEASQGVIYLSQIFQQQRGIKRTSDA